MTDVRDEKDDLVTFLSGEVLATCAGFGPAWWDGGLTFRFPHGFAAPLADLPGVAVSVAPASLARTGDRAGGGSRKIACLGAALPLEDVPLPGDGAVYRGPRLATEALRILLERGSYRSGVTPDGEPLLGSVRSSRLGSGWLDHDPASGVACVRGRRPRHLEWICLRPGEILLVGRRPEEAVLTSCSWSEVAQRPEQLTLTPTPPAGVLHRDAAPPRVPCRLSMVRRHAAQVAAGLWLVGHEDFLSMAPDWPAGLISGLSAWPGGPGSPWILLGGGAHLPLPGYYSPDGGRVWFPVGLVPTPRLGRLERFRAVWSDPEAFLTVVMADGSRLHATGKPTPLSEAIRHEIPAAVSSVSPCRFGPVWQPEPFLSPAEDAPSGPCPELPREAAGASRVPAPAPATVAEPDPALAAARAAAREVARDDRWRVLEDLILGSMSSGAVPAARDWAALADARASNLPSAISCLAASRARDPDAAVPCPLAVRDLLDGHLVRWLSGATARLRDDVAWRALACCFWADPGLSARARRFLDARLTVDLWDASGRLPVQEWWLAGRAVFRDDALGMARLRDDVLRRLGSRATEFVHGMPEFLGRGGERSLPKGLPALAGVLLAWCAGAEAGSRGRTLDFLKMALDCVGLDVGWDPAGFSPRDPAEAAIAAAYAWRKANPEGLLPASLIASSGAGRYYYETLCSYSRILEPEACRNPYVHWASQSSPFSKAIAQLAEAPVDRVGDAFDHAISFKEAGDARQAARVASLALSVAPAAGLAFCRRALEFAINRAHHQPDLSSSMANLEVAKLLELAMGVALHCGDLTSFRLVAGRMLGLAASEGFNLNELESRAFSSYHRRWHGGEVTEFLRSLLSALEGRREWPARAARLYVAAALYRRREVALADSAVDAGFSLLNSAMVKDRRFFVPALAHAACANPDHDIGLARAGRLLAVAPMEADDLSTATHYSVYQIKVAESIVLGFAGAAKPPPGVERWADESESVMRRDLNHSCRPDQPERR